MHLFCTLVKFIYSMFVYTHEVMYVAHYENIFIMTLTLTPNPTPKP